MPWEAIESVTLEELPAAGVLFGIRSLPARLYGRPGLPRLADQPVPAQLPEPGFRHAGRRAQHELVFGMIGQMWKPGGETARIRTGADFLAFEVEGFAKAAMSLACSIVRSRPGSRRRRRSSPPTRGRGPRSGATGC